MSEKDKSLLDSIKATTEKVTLGGIEYLTAIGTEVFARNAAEMKELGKAFPHPNTLLRTYVKPDGQSEYPQSEQDSLIISEPRSDLFELLTQFLDGEAIATEFNNKLFILSDAGMGKTSLLLMLKLRSLLVTLNPILEKVALKFWPNRFDSLLLKIDNDTISSIKEVENPAETNLLLDALDEDPVFWERLKSHQAKLTTNTLIKDEFVLQKAGLMKPTKLTSFEEILNERVREIFQAAKGFRRVVVSCRVQLFPESTRDTFRRQGFIEIGGFSVKRLHISPFSDKQVDEYLTKKYGALESNLKGRARRLTVTMNSLRFRPLLLSYLDYIIDSEEFQEDNTFLLYKTLVSAWLKREFNEKKEIPTIEFQDILSSLQYLAINLLEDNRQAFSLEEIRGLLTRHPNPLIQQLFNKVTDVLSTVEIGGRSLLTRNSNGRFFFAHRSIAEFLTVQILESRQVFSATRLTYSKRNSLQQRFIADGLKSGEIDKSKLQNLEFMELSFIDVDFSGAQLNGTKMLGCCLTLCDFSDTELKRTLFFKSDLDSANFSDCSAQYANFSGSNLTNSDLTNSDFRNAFLNGTNLTNATLNGCKLSLASYNRQTKWPSGFDYENCGAIGPNAILSEDTLEGHSLSGHILFGADLRNLELSVKRVRFAFYDSQTKWPVGFDFKNSYAIGPGTNIKNLRIENLDLFDCDLTDSTFSDSMLLGASFTNCHCLNTDFSGTTFSKVTFRNTLFKRAKFNESLMDNTAFVDCEFISCVFFRARFNSSVEFPKGFDPLAKGMTMVLTD